MKNYLGSNNTKLKRAGIFNWGIPAYQASDGFRTCPAAGTCAVGCYAKQGFFNMPNVASALEERLALSKSPLFVDTIDAELKRRKVDTLRVHDSGDFYSQAYLDRWFEVMRRNPAVKFYCYTKMVPLLERARKLGKLPKNFKVIYSYGGKFDQQIDRKAHAHSMVFGSAAALKKAGYADAHHDDTVAIRSRKVGLIYHGANSKAFTATGVTA